MSPILEVISASKWFYHANQVISALKNVSLSVDKGDVYGIIGQSGAGKSTLIRAIAKLNILSSGKILFHGTDIALMGKEELCAFHKGVGMIFQHFNLLSSRNVFNNIAYPLEIANVPVEKRKERVEELLCLVGLKDKSERYPAQLSGGEKQRVGIARALANHPEIILCDEATSALDPKTTKEILHLLKTINKKLGVTIILITHEMDVIKQICNKVAVIEKGSIVEEGEVVRIFAEPQHSITKSFVQLTPHDTPKELFKKKHANRMLLRLTFTGKTAGEPVMAEIVRKYNVDPNILLGWIDHIQKVMVGTLIIELAGSPEGIKNTLGYLTEKSVHYEVIEHEL